MRLVSELWKSVGIIRGIDFGWKYEVSSKGRLRSIERVYVNRYGKSFKYDGRVITHRRINKNGYVEVKLEIGDISVNYLLHRLVAIAFLINPNEYDTVNHKDEDKTNNDINNLEWCPRGYNTTYGTAVERRTAVGRKHFIPVKQIDLDGNTIAVYNSISEAARAGFSKQMIYNCVHGICGSHKGYHWEIDEM